MKTVFATFLSITFLSASGQAMRPFADSIRTAYKIPELAYAVVSADTVFEKQIAGVQRANTTLAAKPDDRFHIGSNTKAITAFIAALLVESGRLKWNTKFFALFPELKKNSRKDYRNITLQALLTFRGKLPAYTYTFIRPTKKQIGDDKATQGFKLAKYFLSQKPMRSENGLTPSNADYILAGLMLERAAGKTFEQLVTDFGKTQGIRFGFGYPNLSDTLQPWGHNADLKPLPPFENYKLDWLLPAGNINVSLSGYIKFIQLQLQGLRGKATILSRPTFERLLFGLPVFSFGWFNKMEAATHHILAYNEGNAGAFITQVEIVKEGDRAYVIFTNAATEEAEEGVKVFMRALKAKYGK